MNAPAPQSPPLNGEPLVSFATAARSAGVPGARGGPHLVASTLFRWAVKGATAANGMRLKLEAARVGGRWLTSVAAVHRLIAKLTAASLTDSTSDASHTPTPARRARAARAASAAVSALLGS